MSDTFFNSSTVGFIVIFGKHTLENDILPSTTYYSILLYHRSIHRATIATVVSIIFARVYAIGTYSTVFPVTATTCMCFFLLLCLSSACATYPVDEFSAVNEVASQLCVIFFFGGGEDSLEYG